MIMEWNKVETYFYLTFYFFYFFVEGKWGLRHTYRNVTITLIKAPNQVLNYDNNKPINVTVRL